MQGSITEPFTPIQSPAAWYAADYRDSDEWIYRLTPEDLAEIEAAAAEVEASGANVQVRARANCTPLAVAPGRTGSSFDKWAYSVSNRPRGAMSCVSAIVRLSQALRTS